jgi:hypothetical protein
MSMRMDAQLCYAEAASGFGCAWFATLPPVDMVGEGWSEHTDGMARPPQAPNAPHELYVVAWRAPFFLPDRGVFSAWERNSRERSWLSMRQQHPSIHNPPPLDVIDFRAGTPLGAFIEVTRSVGGDVFLPSAFDGRVTIVASPKPVPPQVNSLRRLDRVDVELTIQRHYATLRAGRDLGIEIEFARLLSDLFANLAMEVEWLVELITVTPTQPSVQGDVINLQASALPDVRNVVTPPYDMTLSRRRDPVESVKPHPISVSRYGHVRAVLPDAASGRDARMPDPPRPFALSVAKTLVDPATIFREQTWRSRPMVFELIPQGEIFRSPQERPYER